MDLNNHNPRKNLKNNLAVSNSPSRKSKLKTFAVCILAATFFWLMTALNKDNYTLRLDYPIHFNYNDSLFTPIQPLPNRVTVNVSGDGWNLLRKSWLTFAEKPVQYTILNPQLSSSINSTSLISQIAEHFPDVKVNYVVADTFELGFEKKMSKIVSVRADSLSINLREGHVISSLINTSPSLITVEGPASIIADYPDTLFVPIKTSKIQNNYDEILPLLIPYRNKVVASHSTVFVSFEVARLLRPLPVQK